MPERPPWLGRILITGGTRGIGRATALAASAAGAEAIVLNYLQNEAEAERTRERCEEYGARCVIHRANVGSVNDLDGLVDAVRGELGGLDLFVHCAALNTFKPIERIRVNQWDLTMNIAARAFLLCAQGCAPMMEHGSMLAVSSLGARRVLDNYGALGVAKAALEGVVAYLATEFAPKGIRVNGVTAGPVETASIDHFPDAVAWRAAAAARTPAGRIGTTEEIADVLLFLASPAARWIIGQTIVADGGLSLR
jgi:enoyl-[acyl-carrier protein] reductase III